MKKPLNKTAASFIVLALLVVILLLSNSLRQSPRVVLPDANAGEEDPFGSSSGSADGVQEIQIEPDTVQAAIATLHRPENYARTIIMETIWDEDESSTWEISTAVSGDWVRTDASLPGGRVRHAITNGETTYVWYDSERTVYSGPAGEISGDDEQHIPTYEDILELPVESIAQSDYRTFSDVDCIYVETEEDELGYVQRYWVSVELGLLVGGETLQNGETVYRMASLSVDSTLPDAADFTLPDGTVLHTPD
jgi:hypothetical protein